MFLVWLLNFLVGVPHFCVRMFVNASLFFWLYVYFASALILNRKEVLPKSLLVMCGHGL